MWTRLRPVLLVVAVAFVFSTRTFAADSGADVYKSTCASCNGAAGKGDTAMGKTMKVKDLGSEEVQMQSEPDLTTVIEKIRNRCQGTRAS